jgi:general secretion pathway protein G
MDRNRRRSAADAGFTLIEVLLVVAILGILATIAVVGVGGHMEKASITATRGNIDAIGKAVELYRINFNKMPGSLQDLTRETEDIEAPLRDIPLDAWGNAFQFKRDGKFRYTITSAGPDGSPGTSDDLTN